MDRFKTWLVAAAIGLVVAGVVFLVWPSDDVTNSGDPLAGVPPADSTVTEVLASFETAPVYVDPDLLHLLPDDEVTSLVDHVGGLGTPARIAVMRTGRNDGFDNDLYARVFRIAADHGEDGVYLLVNQRRVGAAVLVEDGRLVDDSHFTPREGRLGPLLEEQTTEFTEDDTFAMRAPEPSPAEASRATLLANGALMGTIGAAVAYGGLMLIVGIVRVVQGMPFRPRRLADVERQRKRLT